MQYGFQPRGGWRSRYTGPAVGGLLSAELWGSEDRPRAIQVADSGGEAKRTLAQTAAATGPDESNDLPDDLIRQYPDLDNDSRNFLKHGPRGAAERLAYAQQVNPLAHLDALLASRQAQLRFQDSGDLDRSQHFVGPDGRVYVRNEDSEEQLGAKIRRGYEQAIGGFAVPTVEHSLGEIDGATRSKRADVELRNPPTLPEQEERQRFLATYHINPTAWQLGDRADEDVQKTFQDGGYLWPAIFSAAYVGPDGVVYYKNDLTREDKFSAYGRVRDWWETQQ